MIEKDKDAALSDRVLYERKVGKVEEALRAGGFARPSQMTDQVPAKEKEELEQRVRSPEVRKLKNDEEAIAGYGDVEK